jgi:hypothetical protein
MSLSELTNVQGTTHAMNINGSDFCTSNTLSIVILFINSILLLGNTILFNYIIFISINNIPIIIYFILYWWYFLWRAISGGPWPEPKDCWDAAPGRRRRVPRMFREIPNIMATTCNHQQDRKVKSYQSNHKSNCSKFLTIGNANMCVFFQTVSVLTIASELELFGAAYPQVEGFYSSIIGKWAGTSYMNGGCW